MKEIKNQINEKKIVVPPHSSTSCVQDISMPSRKEIVEIMNKRGYSLVYEAPNKLTLGFAILNAKDSKMSWNVTVLVDKNAFVFNSSINPGVVKLNTDFFTGVEDDKLFNEIEQYVIEVLNKFYK